MKKLIYILAFLMAGGVWAQDVTFSLENAQVTNDGTNDYYEVDVMVSSSATLYLGTGQFYINYSTAVFGTSVASNGTGVFNNTGSILGTNYWNLIYTDNTDSRVSYAYVQLAPESAYGSAQIINTTPKLFTHLKLQYLPGQTTSDPEICFETGAGFTDLNFTACGGSFGADCFNFPGVQITSDTFDCTGAAIPIVCSGVTNTWDGVGWDNGTPDSTMEVVIAADYNTNAGDIQACKLIVNSGVTLTIGGTDEYVEVQGDIVVNGTLIVEHQGSLVQVYDTATVTNNGSISVNVTTPVLQTRDFMVMGSPMTEEIRTDVYNTAFLVLDHLPANFIPHPDVSQGGTNFADEDGDFWVQMVGGAIEPGRGYIVRPQDSYTDPANEAYYFNYDLGTLNNGAIRQDAIYNGSSNPDGTPNIYANPYASPISADDFINANALVSELYFWEHLTPPSASFPGANGINFSMDDISMYNLSGGVAAANDPTGTDTAPNGMIATSQGFGVKAFGAGEVVFNNGMRRATGNTTLRLAEENVDKIWLQVNNLEYGLGSNTLVAFNPTATEGFDPGYDSNRLATVISLYSQLEDRPEELGIQTLGAFTTDAKVLMGFNSVVEEEATYSISISDMEGDAISDATVFLTDNLLNLTFNLSEGDYYFSSNEGEFKGRFTLSFYSSVLETTDNLLGNIAIVPNPTHGMLYIQSPTGIQLVQVYDMQGRTVVEKAGNGLDFLEVNLEDMAGAVYFLKVHTDYGSVTKRIVKQ
ncbi:MAG: hypothetical protein Aureis2KO_25560 [Aureisphaera sp.]